MPRFIRCHSYLPATLLLLFSIVPVTAVSAAADEVIPTHPALNAKFAFTLGAYNSRSTTAASLGPSSGGTAVLISFEDTLGLDERTLTPFANFLWRFSDRWRLEVDYYEISRDANRALATDVTWGDTTFPAGTGVDSSLDFADVRTSVAYSYFQRKDKDFGVGLGLHVSSIKASINSISTGSDNGDVTAPLPVVNFYGMVALTNEWAVNMRGDWLSLTYGDFSGDVRDIKIDVLYQPFQHIGFGLGVRSLTIDLEIDRSDWRGNARLNFQGPTIFMTATF